MIITKNRRIVLNICATYGRSLFSLVCGLFTSRWVLMGLGQTDYGLYGVIGGLAVFVSFFNLLLSGSISRFYAFSVGKAEVSKDRHYALEECRKWFNTALTIHTIIPIVLMIIGYPLGVWAVEHFLTIPDGRVIHCIWVWRFVCISCFIGMVNVPFSAMYTAKQYIAELTIYSVVQTALTVAFLYYVVSNPGDWLVRYAAWMCALAVIPQLIISIRALRVFPECKIIPRYMCNWGQIKQLGKYAFWQFFGMMGGLVRSQGISLLVNKFFGPVFNASMAVASTVASKTDELSGALQGAFMPVIASLAGAGDQKKMLEMSYRASKYGTILFLLFALPLVFDLDGILTLWLKNPPPLVAPVCLLMFAQLFVDQSARGLNVSVNASGKVATYNFVIGMFMTLTLPVAWLIIKYFGGGFVSVMWVMLAFKIIGNLIGANIAHKVVGFSVSYWLLRIIFPMLVTLAFILGICSILHRMCFVSMPFTRWLFVAIISDALLIGCSWFFVLSGEERIFVKDRVLKKLRRK